MAGRSESGQFDIVSQAEEVVEAYIARYFNFEPGNAQRQRQNSKVRMRGKMDSMEKGLLMTAAVGCLLLTGLITLLFLYF